MRVKFSTSVCISDKVLCGSKSARLYCQCIAVVLEFAQDLSMYTISGIPMIVQKGSTNYASSTGNVFRDLAVSNPEEALAKAELAAKIASLIGKKGLTQVSAAKLLGIDQPKVSALLRGRLSGFSIERLLRFLLMLGQDIKITVQPAPRSRAKARVHVA